METPELTRSLRRTEIKTKCRPIDMSLCFEIFHKASMIILIVGRRKSQNTCSKPLALFRDAEFLFLDDLLSKPDVIAEIPSRDIAVAVIEEERFGRVLARSRFFRLVSGLPLALLDFALPQVDHGSLKSVAHRGAIRIHPESAGAGVDLRYDRLVVVSDTNCILLASVVHQVSG